MKKGAKLRTKSREVHPRTARVEWQSSENRGFYTRGPDRKSDRKYNAKNSRGGHLFSICLSFFKETEAHAVKIVSKTAEMVEILRLHCLLHDL